MKTKTKHLFSAIAVGAFLIMAVASSDNSEQDSNNSKLDNKSIKSTTAAIKVAPNTLYKDYEENEVAADLKYKDKVLQIKGNVIDISKDITDEIYITIDAGDEIDHIQCYFEDSNINEAAKLKKGQKVTVEGTCDGMGLVNVLLKDCSIK